MKLRNQGVMIGADPEFFVKRNGHWISAHGYNCGTKEKPMETKHGHIQNDGMALECNVKPAETPEEFLSNAWGVINDLRFFVRKQDKTADIYPKSSVFFSKNVMGYTPDEAKKLGCDPDWDAYNLQLNPRPDAKGTRLRTGAGHIHIGWTRGQMPRAIAHMVKCSKIAKELDFRLGLATLMWDKDPARRALYGKAGCFRPKPYGMEYRVPSNVLFSNPRYVKYAFHAAVTAVECIDKKDEMYTRYGDDAKNAINNNNYQKFADDWPLLCDKLGLGQ